jgi:hypothetical protein
MRKASRCRTVAIALSTNGTAAKGLHSYLDGHPVLSSGFRTRAGGLPILDSAFSDLFRQPTVVNASDAAIVSRSLIGVLIETARSLSVRCAQSSSYNGEKREVQLLQISKTEGTHRGWREASTSSPVTDPYQCLPEQRPWDSNLYQRCDNCIKYDRQCGPNENPPPLRKRKRMESPTVAQLEEPDLAQENSTGFPRSGSPGRPRSDISKELSDRSDAPHLSAGN